MGRKEYERMKERFLGSHMSQRIALVLKDVLQKACHLNAMRIFLVHSSLEELGRNSYVMTNLKQMKVHCTLYRS